MTLRIPRIHSIFNTLSLGWLSLMFLPSAAPAGETFRLMSYNIHRGEGMDEKVDLERVAGVIKAQHPDAVALQEVDNKCKRTGSVDQPAELARLTGMTAYFQKAMDYGGGEYGICLLTKMPALESWGFALPNEGKIEPRAGQAVKLQAFGGTLTVANTHLDFSSETLQVLQVKDLLKTLTKTPGMLLLSGDFNAVRGSPALSAVAAAAWEVPVKQGAADTFPSEKPDQEIDFAMFYPAKALKVVKYTVLEEKLCSDHRPVLIEVTIAAP